MVVEMSVREKIPGVYIQTHRASGAFYIGASVDVYRSATEDLRRLRKGFHSSKELQKLFDENPYIDSRIMGCGSIEEADNLKRELIAKDFSNPLMLNQNNRLNVSAVYRLTHIPTGYFYIGSANNFTERRMVHEYTLKKGEHMSQKLQELYNENPDPSVLKWDIILAHPRSHAHELEQKLINDSLNDPLLLNKSTNVKGNNVAASLELREKRRAVAKQLWAEGRMRDPSVSGASKKVSIDGNIYDSVVAASKQLNLATHHIYRRVKSDEWPSYQYL